MRATGINISIPLHQQSNAIQCPRICHVTNMDERGPARGPVERRMPLRIGDIDITAMIEKNTDDIRTSKLGSPVYWLSSGEVLCVRRRTGLNQCVRKFGIRRPEKWGVAAIPRAINAGAGFEKESNQRFSASTATCNGRRPICPVASRASG